MAYAKMKGIVLCLQHEGNDKNGHIFIAMTGDIEVYKHL